VGNIIFDADLVFLGWHQGCGARMVRSQRFLGGVRVLTLGVGVIDFFCPTPDVQLDHFQNHTVQFVFKLLKWYSLFWNFCWNSFLAVHHVPLILTAKFNSLYVKEFWVGSRKFWEGRTRIGKVVVWYFTSGSATLMTSLGPGSQYKGAFFVSFFLKQSASSSLWLAFRHL